MRPLCSYRRCLWGEAANTPFLISFLISFLIPFLIRSLIHRGSVPNPVPNLVANSMPNFSSRKWRNRYQKLGTRLATELGTEILTRDFDSTPAPDLGPLAHPDPLEQSGQGWLAHKSPKEKKWKRFFLRKNEPISGINFLLARGT